MQTVKPKSKEYIKKMWLEWSLKSLFQLQIRKYVCIS